MRRWKGSRACVQCLFPDKHDDFFRGSHLRSGWFPNSCVVLSSFIHHHSRLKCDDLQRRSLPQDETVSPKAAVVQPVHHSVPRGESRGRISRTPSVREFQKKKKKSDRRDGIDIPAPNAISFIEQFNQISFWVATEVLCLLEPQDRTRMMKHMLRIADE